MAATDQSYTPDSRRPMVRLPVTHGEWLTWLSWTSFTILFQMNVNHLYEQINTVATIIVVWKQWTFLCCKFSITSSLTLFAPTWSWVIHRLVSCPPAFLTTPVERVHDRVSIELGKISRSWRVKEHIGQKTTTNYVGMLYESTLSVLILRSSSVTIVWEVQTFVFVYLSRFFPHSSQKVCTVSLSIGRNWNASVARVFYKEWRYGMEGRTRDIWADGDRRGKR